MNFKKTLVAVAAVATFSSAAIAEKLSVAATPVPHAEILEFVKPKLAEQGVELVLIHILRCRPSHLLIFSWVSPSSSP